MDVWKVNLVSYYFILIYGCVLCINIDFDDNKDGFFLKSPYHKFKPAEPSVVKESLILTHPAEVYKLRASYGPFEMYQVVPNEFLTNVLRYGETFDKSETQMHRQVIHNMDVSAHLVSRQVDITNPIVQVLIHAQPLTRRQKQDLIYSYYGYSQRWCAQIFVARGEEQLTTVCLLNGDNNACVAGLSLPQHWWNGTNANGSALDVLVFYDIARVEQNQECASVSNTIVPSRPDPRKANSEKKFISTVDLTYSSHSYNENKDQGLIFRIPQIDLRPNTKFDVPVLLEKNAGLIEFVAKVKVRGGLIVEGASTPVDSLWSVFFEPGDKVGTATVTAFLKEDVKYTRSFKMEEIMRWQFRVVEDLGPLASTTARVLWTVDYERNGLNRNSYFPPENSRISAKFNIYQTQADTIVPVLKERSLLNTAVLTGKVEMYNLHVYSVLNDHTFKDVTKDSTCRSTDPESLKVSVICSHIFLDGSETRGAKNVTVLVRTADHMAQFGVRVWVPEPRLHIQFSDSKLSQIRSWKVQRSTPHSRKKREAEPEPGPGFSPLSNPLLGIDKPLPAHHICKHKYQQAVIEVYARFVISIPGEAPKYYRNQKTYVRVTDLVANRLKVSNRNIAKIAGSTVQGVSPGKTDVQVISPTGKLMGSKEIRVGKDKVEIERLMVRVISGMNLHISEDRNLPGALMATVYLRDHFMAQQQEAVLDIAVEFKDGTMLPLDHIDPSEYDLKVTSVNPNVVEVTETMSTSTSLPPSIKAVGNGKGDIIKVILRESTQCQRKRVRTLDTEYVHVMVDFAKDMDFFNMAQRDGNFYQNRANDGYYNQHKYTNKEEYFKHQQELYHQQQQQETDLSHLSAKPGHKIFHVKESSNTKMGSQTEPDEDYVTKEPEQEALEQPVSTKAKHPSPLEIGMYVLVAVFLFAILVFTANCAVFMVRYQRKRAPKGSRAATGSISQAPDWVWIGRATLERNGARNTGCNQPLMAEEDFNGNQMVIPNSVPGAKSQNGVEGNTGGNSGGDSGGSSSGITSSSSCSSGSNRNSGVSTYKGSECSIRITSNPLPDDDSGMGYNEAEWDYEAMGMTYEQLMDYFANLKESSA